MALPGELLSSSEVGHCDQHLQLSRGSCFRAQLGLLG